jgi:hypothetical protein
VSTGVTEQERNQTRLRWGILLVVLSLLSCLALTILFLFQRANDIKIPEFLPVVLHSQLEADYLANPNPTRVPGVRLDLIWDTIRDREPGATDIDERQAILLNSLLTPVPTVTPALLACQGIHFIYASQDTWLDSANPEATTTKCAHLQCPS